MIMIGMAGVCLTVLAPVCPLTISLPSGTHGHSTDTLHTLSYYSGARARAPHNKLQDIKINITLCNTVTPSLYTLC